MAKTGNKIATENINCLLQAHQRTKYLQMTLSDCSKLQDTNITTATKTAATTTTAFFA